MNSPRVVVIGAGIGGLTTAALLAKYGIDTTVLEAHVYPGGCAGTFYHKQYRFDAGATLAGGFYPHGPLDLVARSLDIDSWPARASSQAMAVRLPDGNVVHRWGDERRWHERIQQFGEESLAFWQWQEQAADALWALALRNPAWPPQTLGECADILRKGVSWLGEDPFTRLNPSLWNDAFRPVAAHLQGSSEKLRTFVDAQLLIAAQCGSARANALYGASALDLPRRGIVHLKGGIGALSQRLVDAFVAHGGHIHYRQEAKTVRMERGKPVAVKTARGDELPADIVIANLPPWNIKTLLNDRLPSALRRLPPRPESGWGAFMLYVGLEQSIVPDDFPLHHQYIVREPMGEGNTIFLSLSPEWDNSRAPSGHRALTISTHTSLGPWWSLHEEDRHRYEIRKRAYADRILAAAETVLPGLREAADLVLPGTPVTFQRFTRREWGWVGGFPQVNLFRTWAPCLAPGLWMVGDSIFPGQSTAAVTLGGMRVANSILARLGERVTHPGVSALLPQVSSGD